MEKKETRGRKPTRSLKPRKRKIDTPVGAKLKKLRQKAKFSQAELAVLADINTSHVCRIESGEINPSLDVAQRLVKALGTTLNDLMDMAHYNWSEPGQDLDPELVAIMRTTAGRKVSEYQKKVIRVVLDDFGG